jgi:hypothetical protein
LDCFRLVASRVEIGFEIEWNHVESVWGRNGAKDPVTGGLNLSKNDEQFPF